LPWTRHWGPISAADDARQKPDARRPLIRNAGKKRDADRQRDGEQKNGERGPKILAPVSKAHRFRTRRTKAFAAHIGPPTGALSQEAAAAWLNIPRRSLRSLIERGRLHVAEDGGLYAADLQEQFAVYMAHKAAKKARR
jgi:hypothetical protein